MHKINPACHYPATILNDNAAIKTNIDEMLAKQYSDLNMQSINPSPMRVEHDKLATNNERLHAAAEIKSLFISGAGRYDPDKALNQKQQKNANRLYPISWSLPMTKVQHSDDYSIMVMTKSSMKVDGY
ncbi:PipA/GogA/GtgA family type III secretion system effector [Arsenophonus apicola]|uniref:PipA/GogA/GtgA family type III secretion system effector n=1 Tax=Arsenophonus apicola TaxID=2879119 RepID=UPI00387981FA